MCDRCNFHLRKKLITISDEKTLYLFKINLSMIPDHKHYFMNYL